MFDNLLENLDDVAVKLGLPADQLKSIAESVTGKLGAGGNDQMQALIEAAQQHGLSAEKLQGMVSGLGLNMDDLMGKLGGMLGGDSALGGLGDIAKGLFGKD